MFPQVERVASAGLQALAGQPADAEVQRLAQRQGVSLDTFRGRQVDEAMIRNAELILVMEEAQRHNLCLRFPAARGRVFLLGHWLPRQRREVPDPFGLGPEAMALMLDHLQEGLAAWRPHLDRED